MFFVDKEVSTARGRLKGALMEVLGDESDASSGHSPIKRERYLCYLIYHVVKA